MIRRKPTRHRVFAGALGWRSPQLVVTCVTLTLVCALFVVSRRHSSSPEQALQRGVGTHGTEATLGHQVQFLQSHQNLKHSNLLEDSLDDSDRIFKDAAVTDQDGQDTELDLRKNGDGFLSNVAETQSDVPGVTTTAAPAVDSKPLGFYFSKDIPGHVKEKGMNIRSSSDTSQAVDGKAAMSLYFNKDRRKVDAAAEAQSERIRARDTISQQASTDGQQLLTQGTDGANGSSDSRHRKVLRGISKGIQTGQAVDPESNVTTGHLLRAGNAVNRPGDPLSVALNFSSVKPDDM